MICRPGRCFPDCINLCFSIHGAPRIDPPRNHQAFHGKKGSGFAPLKLELFFSIIKYGERGWFKSKLLLKMCLVRWNWGACRDSQDWMRPEHYITWLGGELKEARSSGLWNWGIHHLFLGIRRFPSWFSFLQIAPGLFLSACQRPKGFGVRTCNISFSHCLTKYAGSNLLFLFRVEVAPRVGFDSRFQELARITGRGLSLPDSVNSCLAHQHSKLSV